MHTIYKYPIEILLRQTLQLPKNAIMLKAEMQGNGMGHDEQQR